MAQRKSKSKDSEPSQVEYIEGQARLYEYLSGDQEKALEELQEFTTKTVETFQAKKDTLTHEKNELERHRTGYFALAISFVVGGLLSSNLGAGTTFASRFLYLITISTAIITAFLIFLDYSSSYKLFTLWQDACDDIIQYINKLKWKTPTELADWISQRQSTLPTSTSPLVQKLELIFLIVSFLSIIFWLIERLFNPNWPIL